MDPSIVTDTCPFQNLFSKFKIGQVVASGGYSVHEYKSVAGNNSTNKNLKQYLKVYKLREESTASSICLSE